MKGFIAEVKAEREKTDEIEKQHMYVDKPMTHFPYTHGDSLEHAREQYRKEAHSDLKAKQISFENAERQKLGDTMYEKLYGTR